MAGTLVVDRSAASPAADRLRRVTLAGGTVVLLAALLISGMDPAGAQAGRSASQRTQFGAASAAERPWQASERVSSSGIVGDAAMAGDTAVVAFTTGDWVRAAYRTFAGGWEVSRLGRGHRPRVAVSADGAAVVSWMRRAGRERLVLASVRVSADAPWSSGEVVTRRGVAPVVAIDSDGRERLLALRWRPDSRGVTAVMAYTREKNEWSSGTRISRRRLHLGWQLRNSLRVTTTPRGRLVGAWQCGRSACMVFPGSSGEEPQTPAPQAKLTVSVSPSGRLWLATRFEISELEPGFVFSESYGVRGKVKRIGLDVGTAGGAVSWLMGANGPLWVGQQRNDASWGGPARVARHAHGIGVATFVEPATVVAVWRNARGRLRLASNTRHQSWCTEGAMGRDVRTARLVSNQDNDALLTWSAKGPKPGVYVAVRLIN